MGLEVRDVRAGVSTFSTALGCRCRRFVRRWLLILILGALGPTQRRTYDNQG